MNAFFTVCLILVVLFSGCHSSQEAQPRKELLEIPGLSWDMTKEEVLEKYPGGKLRQHAKDERIHYYEKAPTNLWGDKVTITFEFWDEYIMAVTVDYTETRYDTETILEKVRAAYGPPWKEYGWQKGVKRWRSEEKAVDRLDEQTLFQYKDYLQEMTTGRASDRFNYPDTLLKFVCEIPLVRLELEDLYEDRKLLIWSLDLYPGAAQLSGPKASGKVSMDTLMLAAKGGQESYTSEGFLQEVRVSLDEEGLEKLKKQFGPSSERYLSYGMPEGSLFWVSEEQVSGSFEVESEVGAYISLISKNKGDMTSPDLYVKMYQTPLVKVYWQEESGEMVWDLTGSANLQKIREARK